PLTSAVTISPAIWGTRGPCSLMRRYYHHAWGWPRAIRGRICRFGTARLAFAAASEAQPAKNGLALALLVGIVARVAGLVLGFALGVQHLEFAQHVHERAEQLRAGG